MLDKWAKLEFTVHELADVNVLLVKDMSQFASYKTLSLLSSLLTIPEYQSNYIRIEMLVLLAFRFCRGHKEPEIVDVSRWFEEIGKSRCVCGEDQAEDVFVSLVYDEERDYRILEGIWESAGFYTQRFIEVVSSMPDHERFYEIKRSFKAILTISDIVCEKSELHRYQIGSEKRHSQFSSPKGVQKRELINRVTVLYEELEVNGVTFDDFLPFILSLEQASIISSEKVGDTSLDKRPLCTYGKRTLIVTNPCALSIAARNYIIEAVISRGLTEAFDGMLQKSYSKLFANTNLFGAPKCNRVLWSAAKPVRVSSFTFKIDDGYYISYHLFLPSIENHLDGGFLSIYSDGDSFLKKSVNKAIDTFSKKEGFKKGLVVYVGCGWGQGIAVECGFHNPNWCHANMSPSDIIRISYLPGMTPEYFWSVVHQIDTLDRLGVSFINPNGVMNLVALARENRGHLAPHAELAKEDVSIQAPIFIQIPINLLREIRSESDECRDLHCLKDNYGKLHILRLAFFNSVFHSDNARRLYISESQLQEGGLVSVYQGELILWVSIKAPNIREPELIRHLFEMVNEWLFRIGEALDSFTELIERPMSLQIEVEFQDTGPPEYASEKPSREELLNLCDYELTDNGRSVKSVYKQGFIFGFSFPDNIAERLFVWNLARSILCLLGEEDLDHYAKEITGRVVKNSQARSFHIFTAQDFADYVRQFLPKYIVAIDDVNDAAAKLRLKHIIDEKYTGHMRGKEKCTSFLNRVVELLISNILESLAEYNRISTINKLLLNCEKASTEASYWKKTSAAIIGLHGENEETISKCVSEISRFNGTSICTRVLMEMALCSCTDASQKNISNMELRELICDISLVIRFGGVSDAIHYNALQPEIWVSPLGDILFLDDFGETVVEPMLSKSLGDKFLRDSATQENNYDISQESNINIDLAEKEFSKAWRAETGFLLQDARNIMDILEDEGINRELAVFALRRDEYFSLLLTEGVPKCIASAFLAYFSLTIRESWDLVPDGFAHDDIYPWRYGRRLSFSVRPILSINDKKEPLLFIAPIAIRKGVHLVVDGAFHGRLKQSFFQSPEMKNHWWGKSRDGHGFTDNVAASLKECGWNVTINIELTEVLNEKLPVDYGDIDVLAWNDKGDEVLVIECKDLSFARNYSEIASLLSDYQGVEKNGKRDSLKKHLDRVCLIKGREHKLEKYVQKDRVVVVSWLVCSGMVPMQYAKIDALEGTFVGSLEDVCSY